MRYAWDQFDAYFGSERVGLWQNYVYRLVMRYFARWDVSTAGRVQQYIAISQYVAGRIRRYYNRAADVIYPPVDTDFYKPDGTEPRDYLVVVSALVPYKRIDLAIDACRLAGVRLRIVGTGPESRSLRERANSTVEFITYLSNDELRELYRGARGFLLTGEEDFGIAPVEAQACGRPVIAFDGGGACETIEHGDTGLLVANSTAEEFADAIESLDDVQFDPLKLHAAAARFSPAVFQSKMRSTIENLATKTSRNFTTDSPADRSHQALRDYSTTNTK